MSVEKSFEDSARQSVVDGHIQQWYVSLPPAIRSGYGLALTEVVRAAMESQDDFARAVSNAHLIETMLSGSDLDKTLLEAHEDACNALRARINLDVGMGPTGYLGIDRLYESQRNVLAMVANDPENVAGVFSALAAAKQTGWTIHANMELGYGSDY